MSCMYYLEEFRIKLIKQASDRFHPASRMVKHLCVITHTAFMTG